MKWLLVPLFFVLFIGCKITSESAKTVLLMEIPYIYDVPTEIKGAYIKDPRPTVEILKFYDDNIVIIAYMAKPKDNNYDYFTKEWCKERIGKYPIFQSTYKVVDNKVVFESFSKGGDLNFRSEGTINNDYIMVNKTFNKSKDVSPLSGSARIYYAKTE